MRWHAGLDDHVATFGAAARTPRDLTQELKRPLRSAEVGQIDADVRVDDTDQRDVRKIEPLGDHLRAEEHVHLPAADAVEDLGVRPLPARRIHVHACDARGGEALGEEPLHLLRSQPTLSQQRSVAARAALPTRLGVPAVVADQALGCPMIGETDRAVGAGGNVAAVAALHERRVAPAIQEENALLAPCQARRERLLERFAEHPAKRIGWARGAVRCRPLLRPHVDHVHRRQ